MASRRRRQKPDAQAIRPHYAVQIFVSGSLGEQLPEIDIRSENRGIRIDLNAVVHALVRIERIVTSVTQPYSSQRRKPSMQIFLWYEFRNDEAGQSSLCQRISQRERLRLRLVDRLLQLESKLSLACIEDRIFSIV